MDELKIKSVKAVMKTLDVSLIDLFEKDDLIGLLREGILNGTLKKEEVLQAVNELPEPLPVKKNSKGSETYKMLHFAKHEATGVEYAVVGNDVVGPIIQGKDFRYILALNDVAVNIPLSQAKEIAALQDGIGGMEWIVPDDSHFLALLGMLNRVNRFLEAFDGDKIGTIPYLSASSQSNPPSRWKVRLILPLKDKL